MKKNRDDFSELILAYQTSDDQRVNELLSQLFNRLEMYLMVVHKCSKDLAPDLVQEAMHRVIKKMQSQSIKDARSLLAYCMTSCKNEYYAYLKKEKKRILQHSDVEIEELPTDSSPLAHLIEEDRQRILEKCIEKLNESNKKLIQFLLLQPEASPEELTRMFNISYANIRTRKSRIIQALKDCFLRFSTS
ncbi:MAG: sigma-70 family RNA polymerase sigma factor [Bacteroidetes bacterium]|nr:sigma-70 family RNA polymerase sigma factor [Bacteroidota bacterium]